MKNKGFTIIELLSVFIILALLSSVGIISYNFITKKVETNYYKTLENNLLLSGNEFYNDNRGEKPIDDYSSVSINELIEKKYIDGLKDRQGNICTGGNVYIYKADDKGYAYEACLECGDYKTEGKYCDEKTPGVINISARSSGASYNTLLSYSNTPWAKEDVSVTFSMIDNVNKYIIKDINTNEEIVCNSKNNTCSREISKNGSYLVTGYLNNDQVGNSKYFNVKIDRNLPSFNIDETIKFIISDGENKYNYENNVKNLKDDSGIKSVKYSLVKKNVVSSYKDVNDNLIISEELESGVYKFEVEVTDYAGNKTKKEVNLVIGYNVDLEYNDVNRGTIEVVKGEGYGFLERLSSTMDGNNVRWYLNENEVTNETVVSLGSKHTLNFKYVITIPNTALCVSRIYNGNVQTLTSTTSGTGYNLSGYNQTNADDYVITASLIAGYVWGDGTNTNKTFTCSIGKISVTYRADSATKIYDGTALTKNTATLTAGSLVSGHTASFTISGSQTSVGSSTNTLSTVTIKSGTTDVSSNYNITKQNGTLTITDSIKPSCSFIGPSITWLRNGTSATYILTCTDNVGFSDSSISSSNFILSNSDVVDISPPTKSVVNNNYEYTITVTGYVQGSTTLTLEAGSVIDVAGNINEAVTSDAINVDTIAPNVTLNASSCVQKGTTKDLKEYITYTDDDSGIKTNSISVKNGATNVTNLSAYNPGSYTITYTMSDNAGNIKTLTVNFNVYTKIKDSNIVTIGSGLYSDSVTPGRYVYRGMPTNNYVNFANSTWRIVAIEADGRYKLVNLNSGIEDSYDKGDVSRRSNSSYCRTGYVGCNAWGTLASDGAAYSVAIPSQSTVYRYLNGTYKNQLLIGGNISGIAISSKFKVGSVTSNSDAITLSNIVNLENKVEELSTIGMLNLSDYMMATSNTTCNTYGAAKSSNCYSNNWLATTDMANGSEGNGYWLLTPRNNYNDDRSFFTFNVVANEGIKYSYSNYTRLIHPVIYLNPTTTFIGSGTSSNPYTVNNSCYVGDDAEVFMCLATMSGSTVTVNAYNGKLPYSYVWNDGSRLQSRSALSSVFNWTVTASDSNGSSTSCTFSCNDWVSSWKLVDSCTASGSNTEMSYTTCENATSYKYHINIKINGSIIQSIDTGYVYSTSDRAMNACRAYGGTENETYTYDCSISSRLRKKFTEYKRICS